jgi:hypothetical protein
MSQVWPDVRINKARRTGRRDANYSIATLKTMVSCERPNAENDLLAIDFESWKIKACLPRH